MCMLSREELSWKGDIWTLQQKLHLNIHQIVTVLLVYPSTLCTGVTAMDHLI